MQGYDSVAMDVDMELGGNDQTFNMLIGRDLMKALKQKEKFVLTTKLLVDPVTGKKLMNKSEGGLVNLDDDANDMFGKVMALPDSAIASVAEFSTSLPMVEVEKLKTLATSNPRDAKLKVASAVVETLYSKSSATKAGENFIKVYSKKDPSTAELLEFKIKTNKLSLLDLLMSRQDEKLLSLKSKTEFKRLISDGAVAINGVVKKDFWEVVELKGGETLKIGRNFFRVKVI
jgi:tyrosyl-tRNA synthetase